MKGKALSPYQLKTHHLGKHQNPLENGDEIYGTIQGIRGNGMIFIPATKPLSKHRAKSTFFPLFRPHYFYLLNEKSLPDDTKPLKISRGNL